MVRYLIIDTETTGNRARPKPGDPPVRTCDYPLPWADHPIQISIDAVEYGEITHLYDTLVKGATQFSPWVRENVPITLESLADGKDFAQVIREVAALIKDGDCLVAHCRNYDIDQVVVKWARCKNCLDMPELKRITNAAPFCTLRCPYTQTALPFGGRKLHHLCDHFGVALEGAHDARADTHALAECVAEAWRRGVMLPEFTAPEDRPELKRKVSHVNPAALCGATPDAADQTP
jgi:DNA polymerase III epsilon subunit-like protein